MLERPIGILKSVFGGSDVPGEDNSILAEAADHLGAEGPGSGAMRFDMDDLPDIQALAGDAFDTNDYWANWSGDKFLGGYGDTPILHVDYVTLRNRSIELFTNNLYARGIIRRYLANIINTGIELEAQPDNSIVGMSEEAADDWAEQVENLFSIWGNNQKLADYHGLYTYSELQAIAKQAALIIGDVLVLQHIDEETLLPKIQIIPGNKINTSSEEGDEVPTGHVVTHGVEVNQKGEHTAFFVDQADGTSKRIPAIGKNTGRRVAWLVYGTDHLIDEVRGQPMLSIVLQSLKEIDRYRDSAQRKALVNSFVAMFVKRDQPGISTNPISNMAVQNVKKSAETVSGPVKIKQSKLAPGMALERLGVGETPVMLGGDGTDQAFSDFERCIMSAIAWALETPPEILMMTFNKNYSASQAAINEYRLIINKERLKFGFDFCQPTYQEFLISQVLAGKIKAEGFLDAWRDPMKWDIFGAWVRADWFGTIKPSADMLKTVKAYQALIDGFFITYAQATRELTGKKWRIVIKSLKREKIIIAETVKEISAINPELAGDVLPGATAGNGRLLKLVAQASEDFRDELLAQVEDSLEQAN